VITASKNRPTFAPILSCRQEVTELNCKVHGLYSSLRNISDSGAASRWTRCPKCAAIEDAEIELAESRRAAEEREGRQLVALERRRVLSGIRTRFSGASLDNFVFDDMLGTERLEAQKIVGILHRYVAKFDDCLRVGRSLLLVGKKGAGKTHLACAVANALLLSGRSVLVTTETAILQDFEGAKRFSSDASTKEVAAKYVAPDLLVIDEVGRDPAWSVGPLAQILDERYAEMRPCIIVSNLTGPSRDASADLLDPTTLTHRLGAPIMDRLRENGGMALPCAWGSYRGRAEQDEL
jgi:DNA replication protein DnaC